MMKFLLSLIFIISFLTSCGIADSPSKAANTGTAGTGGTGTTPASPTDATLSAFTTNVGVLSPAFTGGTITYNLTVPGGTFGITITPTATNPLSTITYARNGAGYQGITSGATSGNIVVIPDTDAVMVRVLAQDAVTQITYTINVID